jgi:hypothetical protein
MGRILVTVVLPVLAPAAVYFGWFYWAQQRAVAAGEPEKAPKLGDVPWFVLAAAGVFIVAVILFASTVFEGAEPGLTYTPPHIVDGKIAPATTK